MIASHLACILKCVTSEHEYSVKNSFEFVEDLETVKLKRGHIKVSFDVISLFTNVSIKEGLTFVRKRLENSTKWRNETALEIDDIIDMLDICVNCTYFSYNNITYHQKDGTAMGSPVSTVFAEIVLQELESAVVKNLPLISFYRRYMDDVYSHIHERKCQDLLNELNSFHPSIQFTIEKEQYNEEKNVWELPFLDVMTYTRSDQSIGHYVYRKPTFVNTYLMYTSFHPQAHKIGVTDTLFTRALRLCDEDHIDPEIRQVFDMLTQRGYPKKLLDRRLDIVKDKEEIRKRAPKKSPLPEKPVPRIILAYFGQVTIEIARFLRLVLDVEIGYIPGIKLGALLSNFKTKLPKPLVGVYELLCEDPITGKDCDYVYVGETGKGLEERFQQHVNDVRNENPNSAVATHVNNTGHILKSFRLLEYEPRTFIRKVKEALFIRAVPKTMNNNNGYRINPIWSSRLVEFFKFKYKSLRKT